MATFYLRLGLENATLELKRNHLVFFERKWFLMITKNDLKKVSRILLFWEDFSEAFCPAERLLNVDAEAITFSKEYGWLISTQTDFLRRMKNEWFVLYANQIQGKGTLIKSIATKAVFLDECIRVLPKMAYCVYANPSSAPVSQMKRSIGGNLFFLRPGGGKDGSGSVLFPWKQTLKSDLKWFRDFYVSLLTKKQCEAAKKEVVTDDASKD